jgi:hypothetical protein
MIIRREDLEQKQIAKLAKSVQCAYCSSSARGACVACELPMCKKHQAIYADAIYCRRHKQRFSGIATDAKFVTEIE